MGKLKQNSDWIFLALLLLAGLALRLYHFDGFSLTNDELSAYFRTQYNNFHDLISQGVAIDYHPAGVQVFLFYQVKVFGHSEAALRFPFVIAGTLAILFTYLFARQWFGSKAALLAAGFIAVLPFPVIYSQIARPYASGLMLSTLLAWLWSVVLHPTPRQRKHIYAYAFALALAIALNLYNHYFSGLLAFIIGISGFSLVKRETLKPYLLALGLSSLLFLPHLKMTLYHLSKGGLSSWLAAPSWGWIPDHFTVIFGFWLFFIVLLAFTLIPELRSPAFSWKGPQLRIRILLLLFFLLPLAIGFFYSRMVNPVLQHSILIFSMPFLIVWLSSFKQSLLNKNIVLSLIGVFILTWFVFDVQTGQPMISKQNFKGVATALQQWEKEYQKEKIIRFMESNSPDYITYYLDEENKNMAFAHTLFRQEEDLWFLKNALDTTRAELLEYAILAPDNPIAKNMMLKHFPYVADKVFFSENAQAMLLSKTNTLGKYNYWRHLKKDCIYQAVSDSTYDISATTYSPGAEWKCRAPESSYRYVYAELQIPQTEKVYSIQLVFEVFDTKNKKISWQSAPLKYFSPFQKAETFRYLQPLNLIPGKGYKLKVYLWNPEHETFKYRNLIICLTRKIEDDK